MNTDDTHVRAKRKQILSVFVKANALSPKRTIDPKEMSGAPVFKKLVRQRVLVRNNESGYYFDKLREKDIRASYRGIFVVIVAIIVILAVGFYFYKIA